jgi:hypothetical protein
MHCLVADMPEPRNHTCGCKPERHGSLMDRFGAAWQRAMQDPSLIMTTVKCERRPSSRRMDDTDAPVLFVGVVVTAAA